MAWITFLHSRPPETSKLCHWIYGLFSNLINISPSLHAEYFQLSVNLKSFLIQHTWWFQNICTRNKNICTRNNAVPPLSKMFWAVGCQTTRPTRRWCATRSATGSSRLAVSPPSGICQTLTVQSSDPLAIRSSSCGHHWISSTAALCPTTSGASRSTRPTCHENQMN